MRVGVGGQRFTPGRPGRCTVWKRWCRVQVRQIRRRRPVLPANRRLYRGRNRTRSPSKTSTQRLQRKLMRQSRKRQRGLPFQTQRLQLQQLQPLILRQPQLQPSRLRKLKRRNPRNRNRVRPPSLRNPPRKQTKLQLMKPKLCRQKLRSPRRLSRNLKKRKLSRWLLSTTLTKN